VTGIAKSTVHEVISDLNFCKLSARWVRKMLSLGSTKMKIFGATKMKENRSWENIITGDETWVYVFTPQSKGNSMTWKHPHSNTTKKIQNRAICEKNDGDCVLGL
jgi:hypothetical protein